MNRLRVFLKPAEWCFCESPTMVETVLGSCVAVVMWSRGVGCICHCVLPEGGRVQAASARGPAAYVDEVLDPMLAWFRARGIPAVEVEVKLFGGAELTGLRGSGYSWSPGPRNVETSRRLLAERSLPVKAFDVGGTLGRKLVFFSDSGDVYLKCLGPRAAGKR